MKPLKIMDFHRAIAVYLAARATLVESLKYSAEN
jgi:hypothetical protein